ncbi:MAG: triose-phosphate isomerase [Candidatus Falkowbacteria bacterium]
MQKLIIANWKMNLGLAESRALAAEYKKQFAGWVNTQIVACPSEFALTTVAKELKGSKVSLGAQNCFWESKGAFTGETSATALQEIGCQYILLGHSERREYLGESCRQVNLKLKNVLSATRIMPVVCVGENAKVRKAGKHLAFVDGQLKRALTGIKWREARLVIAYEPIWAIGTGLVPSTQDAAEMHLAIRSRLIKLMGADLGRQVPILYGGSVSPANSTGFLKIVEVGGLLVGGASLEAAKFNKIANFKQK